MTLGRTEGLLLGLIVAVFLGTAHARDVTVGVYQNEPKIFTDTGGRASGLFIDLIREIATREGWSLTFQTCDWKQCLEGLRTGAIDVLPDVAYSKERARRFDFHRQPALNSWSQLYGRADSPLVSILHLEDKRVAVLEGSIQQQAFSELVDDYGVDVEVVGVGSYPEAFRRVRDQEVSAAITNHQYGARFASQFELVSTPIVFQPVALYFATGSGRNADLLAAIDQRLKQWRDAPDSVYFDILDRWQSLPPKPLIPPRLVASLVTAIVLLMLTLGCVIWLRREVAHRTRDLRESEHKLSTILDSVGAFIYIKGRDGRYIYANKKTLDNFKLTEAEVIGKYDDDILDRDTALEWMHNDRKVLSDGQPLTVEESLRHEGGQETYVSVKLPLRDRDNRVYALCGISTDITEQKKREQKIHNLAYYNPHTGLPNRAFLLDYLAYLVDEHDTHEAMALLVIDFDQFKNINDYHGHECGNDLLREAARRLDELRPENSELIHLGADEFVIVVTHLTGDDQTLGVQALCNLVLGRLRQRYSWPDFNYHCTASIGVVVSDAPPDEPLDSLLKHGELAMHQAKQNGRNRFRFYTSDMQDLLQSRMSLEADLRDSVQREEFFLVYQPQVDTNERVVGAEALLRWQHPKRGLVPPAEFIPVAESSGLIQTLGRWVLKSACDQLARWAGDPRTQALTLSVNVSAWQFRASDFVLSVQTVLRQTGAPPERLKLELTESMLIDDMEDAIDKITALKSLGVQVALDDFGTGYSSLAYLKRLPLGQLKIDQSFVADVMTNAVAGAIARTIIRLGRSLNIDVIAEGVETDAQKHWLAAAGCLSFQGFYLGRPDTADALIQRLPDPDSHQVPSMG